MDFLRKYVYLMLGLVCILAVGALYLVRMGREAVVVSPGLAGGGEADYLYVFRVGDGLPQDIILDEGATSVAPPIEFAETVIEYIAVHIVGEVYSPGFIELPAGSRVNCAVELAGGFTAYADVRRVNLAEFVSDAMQIIVPIIGGDEDVIVLNPATALGGGQHGVGATQPGANQAAPAPGIVDGIVNINTATSTQLQTLPGIGPVIAQNIIDHREAHGGFNSVDELINVPRIGTVTLDNLRDRVSVG